MTFPRLRLAAFLLLFCLPVTPAFAADPAPPPAFDAAAAFAGFDAQLTQALPEFRVPGLAIGVVKDGQLVYAKGFGLRDVAAGLPVTEHTVFPIGSITKSFTTLLLAQLVDEGKLDWDVPVRSYLPDFALSDPYISEHVTLRDMCSHRTGLPRHDGVWYESGLSRPELVQRMRYLDFSAELREHYDYNNLMYMAAGYAGEVVSGQSWEQRVRERIFAPLGMTESCVSIGQLCQGPDFARAYTNDDPQAPDAFGDVPYYEPGGAEPAGAVNSSVVDMAKYATLHLNGGRLGEGTLVSPGQIRQMHSAQVAFGSGPVPSGRAVPIGYGLGWNSQVYRGHYCVYHGGAINNFLSQLMLFPQDGAAVIVLTNTGTSLHEIAAYDAADRVLGLPAVPRMADALDAVQAAQAEPAPAAPASDGRVEGTAPAHALSDYAGRYIHPGYGEMKITEASGALSLAWHEVTAPLEHYHYEVFEVPQEGLPIKAFFLAGKRLQFETAVDGLVTELSVSLEPAVDPQVFTRAVDSPLNDPAFLAAVLGDYMLDGEVMTVGREGDNLTLLVPGQPLHILESALGGDFSLRGAAGYGARFVIDPAGGPAKLVLLQPDGEYAAQKVAR